MRRGGSIGARVFCLAATLSTVMLVATSPGEPRSGPPQVAAVAPNEAELAWPAPPAPARVRLARSLQPSTSRERRSGLRRLWNVLTGERPVAAMHRPYGMAVDAFDNLYVADSFNRTIHVFELSSGRYSSRHVDGDSLIGVAALGRDVVFTDSARARVVAVDGRGRTRWALGADSGFQRPTGIASGDDRIYVVDTLAHRIVVVSATGAVIDRFGSHGSEPGQFNYPTHIARDAGGRLYVTDSMNFRVQVLSPEGRSLRAFGKLGDGSGDFSRPKGIGVDSDNHVYVVDGYLDVVQIFDETGRFLLHFGSPGLGPGQFWLATGLLVHKDRIFVTDATNGRVQMFEYLKLAP